MKGIFYALLVVFTIAIIVPLPPIPIDTVGAASSQSETSPLNVDELFDKIVDDEDYLAIESILKPKNIYTVQMGHKRQVASFVSDVEILGRSNVQAVIVRLIDHSHSKHLSRFPIFDNEPDCAIVSHEKMNGAPYSETRALFALNDYSARTCRINWESGDVHYRGVIQSPQVRSLYRARFQHALFSWASDHIDQFVNALENGTVIEEGSVCADAGPYGPSSGPWQISAGDKSIYFEFFCTTNSNVGGVVFFPLPGSIIVPIFLTVSQAHPWFLQIKDMIETFLDQY